MRYNFLLSTFCFLLFILLIACGRRGDPVVIIPVEGMATEKVIKDEKLPLTEMEDTGVSEGDETLPPKPPTGLVAVYTRKSIVLTWDEITNQDIKGYNIYRSTGDGYTFIGMTITPAFTDTNVKPNTSYLYRVTAVGKTEGLPSKEIEVLTEFR